MSQIILKINPRFPWFGNLSSTFFCITAYIALKKYGRILSRQDLYETTVKISPNGIAHVLNGAIVWMNSSMSLLLKPEEGEKIDIKDMIHAIQPQGISKSDIIDGIAGGSINGSVIYINDKTQNPLACMINCAPLEPDKPENGLVLVTTDISEENRIKKELFDLNKKLEEMAHIDSLTEIANRRRFDLVFSQEWSRAERNNTPLSFILLDIDFFKKYNDRYGHEEGDKCLYTVARALSSCTRRSSDVACRIGGEEFCLILPDTPVEGALLIAEKIRSKIENLKISNKDSTVSDYITVSLGVCCAEKFKGIPSQRLYQTADKALYKAKNSGRNRIETGELPVEPGK